MGHTKISHTSVYGKNKVKIFLDWLYKDSEMFMTRKFKKYLNYYYPVDDAKGNAEALLAMKRMGLKIKL